MPVKKIGNKWEVNKETYDTEELANKAYMAYLDAALGVPKTKPKTKKKPVAASEDPDTTDLRQFGHD